MPDEDARIALDRAWREQWPRLVAGLAREFRDLDTAEDAAGDAFAEAARTWPRGGVPTEPAAWLWAVGRRRAVDRWRRTAVAERKAPLLVGSRTSSEPNDDRASMIFTCCHPALAPAARVALTLRYAAGISTEDIAALFLVPVSTMAARLTRARRKIQQAGVPFRVPDADELPERLPAVLSVVYLMFTHGYAPGDVDAADAAISVGRVLRTLMPTEPEVAGLLALMLLHHARRDARVDDAGEPILLSDQDRRRWRHAEIVSALRLLRGIDRDHDGRYVVEAHIAAEHAIALTADATNWTRIVRWYRRLETITASPVVRVNRAVAVTRSGDPAAALALLDGLDEALPRSSALWTARSDALEQLGRVSAAIAACDRAIVVPRSGGSGGRYPSKSLRSVQGCIGSLTSSGSNRTMAVSFADSVFRNVSAATLSRVTSPTVAHASTTRSVSTAQA
ncbi:RNA polymerase sigma factor [Stackebrandtia soli]|uniref:RNA polymerase sigma factor n=1 Tax=Stackebrandtia soli TaxID=1892856 RepID=UPI0039E979EA